jgi:uncharacterized protein YbjT (DUF2867 family)
MTIAVTGGSGTLRHHIVEELRARGHDVRPLSRRSAKYPVDLRTGAGLPDAVAGCEVVIDASNDNSKHAEETLVGGSRRLLAAEQAVGALHHICISIIGCDQMPLLSLRTDCFEPLSVAAKFCTQTANMAVYCP